jgi:hypothetical protein
MPQPPKRELPELNVKTRVKFTHTGNTERGVVVKADKDGITLKIPPSKAGEAEREELFPVIDLLADGKVHENALDRNAYRLTDIQKGDTVTLHLLRDEGDKVRYCVEIQLERRPKGKIPASQKPDPKRPYHEVADIINRILNDEAVDEDEVDRVCPIFYDSRSTTGLPKDEMRRGMPSEVKAKYDAQLEKRRKEKELKAVPVTDKSGPKKDDQK